MDYPIESQVVLDSVEEYNIAKRQGDSVQICVQAGMVRVTYLQANDEASYSKWKIVNRE